ncbi:MAG: hypothetical protein CL489_08860 [Acidobacteria bacterium]|nr:hypothetical protein [Acidobacteriota bacterium]|tara:strand:- start:459 stop:914 length:456 start_codon:yes stop_codon:yes gene_type:complete
MFYEPKKFTVKELVPPEVYEARGEKALELIDVRIVMILDHLREKLDKPITVNSWSWGGHYSQSGLRDVGHYGSSEKYFNSFSQHKYGRGVDFRVKGMTAEEVRQYIYDHKDEGALKYVTFVEEDVSWVHVDVRNCERITRWSPDRGFLERL